MHLARKVGGLPLAAFVVLTVTFCADIGTAAALTKPQLQAKALAVSDLPTGWSTDTSFTPAASTPGCLKGLRATFRHEVKVQVAYTDGNEPSLQETVETGPGIIARYRQFVRVLSNCKKLSYTTSGQKVTGTISPMSFPVLGTQSSAFAASLSVATTTIGVDLVLFRVGAVAGDLVYEAVGTPDVTQVQGLVTEAVDKIEGKATDQAV